MKDLIEQLKQNEKPYCVLSDVLKAKLQSMPEDSLECLQCTSELDRPDWYKISSCKWTNSNALNIFRVHADYTEPVEELYELCEIKNQEGDLCWFNDDTNTWWALEQAAHYPNFAGYLYKDGKVSTKPRRYKATGNGTIYPDLPIGWFNAGTVIVLRPTHVVFKK